MPTENYNEDYTGRLQDSNFNNNNDQTNYRVRRRSKKVTVPEGVTPPSEEKRLVENIKYDNIQRKKVTKRESLDTESSYKKHKNKAAVSRSNSNRVRNNSVRDHRPVTQIDSLPYPDQISNNTLKTSGARGICHSALDLLNKGAEAIVENLTDFKTDGSKKFGASSINVERFNSAPMRNMGFESPTTSNDSSTLTTDYNESTDRSDKFLQEYAASPGYTTIASDVHVSGFDTSGATEFTLPYPVPYENASSSKAIEEIQQMSAAPYPTSDGFVIPYNVETLIKGDHNESAPYGGMMVAGQNVDSNSPYPESLQTPTSNIPSMLPKLSAFPVAGNDNKSPTPKKSIDKSKPAYPKQPTPQLGTKKKAENCPSNEEDHEHFDERGGPNRRGSMFQRNNHYFNDQGCPNFAELSIYHQLRLNFTVHNLFRLLSWSCGMMLAVGFIKSRLTIFFGRHTTTNSQTKLYRDNTQDVDSSSNFPAVSICHAFGATMDLSLIYHVHWVETLIKILKRELVNRPILWAQLLFACRTFNTYRDGEKYGFRPRWIYPSDYKGGGHDSEPPRRMSFTDRHFLCPRTWSSIVHEYSDNLDPSFVKLWTDPPPPDECLERYAGGKRCKVLAKRVTWEEQIKNANFSRIDATAYWRIMESWAWDTFEVLQYRVGEDVSYDDFINYYIPFNIPRQLGEEIYRLVQMKALRGARQMWNTEKKHWSFNWHRRASNMLEAMSIEENADDANQVLYIEYDLTNKKNHSQPVRKPQRPVKYTVIVDGKLWEPAPLREVEEVEFENILTKTYHALPWETISDQSKLDNPALSDIYNIFGINPEMHLIVAAYNKQDLRKYHSHVKGFPDLYEKFYSHKGSCIRINMDKVLEHMHDMHKYDQTGKFKMASSNRVGWGNGLQLVFWTGSPNLIAKTNTLLGRFTLPSPYGVLHGYELSGAQFTLNVHSPVVDYPNLQDSIAISPGFVQRIGLTLHNYQHKEKEKLGSCDAYTKHWVPGNASEHVCLRDCMTKILYDTCRCKAPYGSPQFDQFKRGDDNSMIADAPDCKRSDLIDDKDLVVFHADDMSNRSTAAWQLLGNPAKLNHSCRHQFRKNLAAKLNLQDCECPRQCNYTHYHLKTEMSTLHKLPRHISNRALIHKIAKYYENMVGEIGPLEEHLSVIDLSFITLDSKIFTEKVTDSIEELVSDLGGQLGLWLGMSVLSLFEVIYFCSVLFGVSLFSKDRNRIQQTLRKSYSQSGLGKKASLLNALNDTNNYNDYKPVRRAESMSHRKAKIKDLEDSENVPLIQSESPPPKAIPVPPPLPPVPPPALPPGFKLQTRENGSFASSSASPMPPNPMHGFGFAGAGMLVDDTSTTSYVAPPAFPPMAGAMQPRAPQKRTSLPLSGGPGLMMAGGSGLTVGKQQQRRASNAMLHQKTSSTKQNPPDFILQHTQNKNVNKKYKSPGPVPVPLPASEPQPKQVAKAFSSLSPPAYPINPLIPPSSLTVNLVPPTPAIQPPTPVNTNKNSNDGNDAEYTASDDEMERYEYDHPPSPLYSDPLTSNSSSIPHRDSNMETGGETTRISDSGENCPYPDGSTAPGASVRQRDKGRKRSSGKKRRNVFSYDE